MASKRRDPFDIASLSAAIRAIAGPLPPAWGDDPVLRDTWRVMLEAVRAARERTPDQIAWLRRAAQPWGPRVDAMRSNLARVVMALGVRTPANVRRVLERFDPLFGSLTDEQINAALSKYKTPRNADAMAAMLSHACGAWGDDQQSVRNVAAKYRSARRRIAARSKKTT